MSPTHDARPTACTPRTSPPRTDAARLATQFRHSTSQHWQRSCRRRARPPPRPWPLPARPLARVTLAPRRRRPSQSSPIHRRRRDPHPSDPCWRSARPQRRHRTRPLSGAVAGLWRQRGAAGVVVNGAPAHTAAGNGAWGGRLSSGCAVAGRGAVSGGSKLWTARPSALSSPWQQEYAPPSHTGSLLDSGRTSSGESLAEKLAAWSPRHSASAASGPRVERAPAGSPAMARSPAESTAHRGERGQLRD